MINWWFWPFHDRKFAAKHFIDIAENISSIKMRSCDFNIFFCLIGRTISYCDIWQHLNCTRLVDKCDHLLHVYISGVWGHRQWWKSFVGQILQIHKLILSNHLSEMLVWTDAAESGLCLLWWPVNTYLQRCGEKQAQGNSRYSGIFPKSCFTDCGWSDLGSGWH